MKVISKEIYWPILILMISGLFISEKLFFVLSMMILIFTLYKNHFRFCIPGVPGLKLYLSLIIVGAIVGGFLYNPRNVIRDLYYFLPSIVWIFLGYNLQKIYGNKLDLLKMVFLYGVFVSLYDIICFILNFSLDFESIRGYFGLKVYEVGFVLPILAYMIFVNKKKYFGYVLDRVMLSLMFIQIFFSLGRIAIVEPIIVIFCLLVYEQFLGTRGSKSIGAFILILIGLVIFSCVMFRFLPSDVTDLFLDKLMNSQTEISSNNVFNSTASAMQNWRSYEIQATKEQWLSSGLYFQIFGEGLGNGLRAAFIPHTWEGFLEGNVIPLLHNGFYTCLEKLGALGLIGFMLLFLGNIYKGVKSNRKHRVAANILVAVSVGAIANTYVVRGPIQQGTFLIWALFIGYFTGVIRGGKIQDDKWK